MRNEVLRAICSLPNFPILSPADQAMLLYLGIHINHNGLYWGGHSRLSVNLGMDIRTVNRTLKSLERRGFIKRIREGGGRVTAVYELFIPGRDEGEMTRMTPVKTTTSGMANFSPDGEGHGTQVEDPRGYTPYKPAVHETAPPVTSQPSVSTGGFAEPPSMPGKPHTFQVPFDRLYKLPDPKW